jgi:hypothetical protein
MLRMFCVFTPYVSALPTGIPIAQTRELYRTKVYNFEKVVKISLFRLLHASLM